MKNSLDTVSKRRAMGTRETPALMLKETSQVTQAPSSFTACSNYGNGSMSEADGIRDMLECDTMHSKGSGLSNGREGGRVTMRNHSVMSIGTQYGLREKTQETTLPLVPQKIEKLNTTLSTFGRSDADSGTYHTH